MIKIIKGKSILIDKEDLPLFSSYSWHLKNGKYLCNKSKKFGSIYFHRLIMNPPADKFIDHIDRNTFNNCKSNLRIVNKSQNALNSKPNKKNTSGYRGVTFDKYSGSYRVRIVRETGKIMDFGRFKNFEDAKRVRIDAEKIFLSEYISEYL